MAAARGTIPQGSVLAGWPGRLTCRSRGQEAVYGQRRCRYPVTSRLDILPATAAVEIPRASRRATAELDLLQDDVPAKLVRAGDIAYEDLIRAVPTASADLFTPPVIARLDEHVAFILPGLGAGGEFAHTPRVSDFQ